MLSLLSARPARRAAWTAVGLSSLAGAASSLAQCPFIDFENFPVGTTITTQYPGVKFGGAGVFGCPIGAPIFTIQTISGATSPTQVLATSPNATCRDGMRIDFTTPQRQARFNASIIIGGTLGSTLNLTVRALDASNAVLTTQVVPIPVGWGSTPVGNVFRSIVVNGRQGCDIAAIQILPPDNIQIAIDDLRWGEDTTPPTVRIDDPPYQFCVCGSTMTIKGISCDPDGCTYTDKLEMRPVNAAPGTPWTLVGTTSGPRCSPTTLYNVNVSGLPGGLYYVRLTGTNSCGVSDNDVTVVNLDRTPPTIDLRCPTANQILSSPIVFDGTVDDFCSVSYTVGYAPAGGAVFNPVNPLVPIYSPGVINDPFATWNTATGPAAVADGPYDVRVRATDGCGLVSTVTRRVIVDNTAPIADIISPSFCRNVCGVVPIVGTASDANLSSWTLQYFDIGGGGWVTIASGTSNVTNGVLANWNTTNLSRCCYVLRLVVEDRANGGCTGRDPNRTIDYLTVTVGAYANCDGSTTAPILNPLDFQCFLQRYQQEITAGTCTQ